jgi:2-polyprenyl-3-methyl-5-hydroxy-6-metoxy-1,4-benzoquinol methylase
MLQEKSEYKIYSFGGTKTLDYITNKQRFISVLDIGCGNGEMGSYLKSKYNCVVTGVTISESEFNIANNLLDDVYLYNIENGLPDLLLKNKYDVILLSHVLEHICYPENLLKHIKILCNPDSQIIISIPNLMFYKSRLKLFFGIFEYANKGIYDFTHFRWYTLNSLINLFAEYGYQIEKKAGTISIPFGRFTNYFQYSLFGLFCKKILEKISLGLFSWEIILIVKYDQKT